MDEVHLECRTSSGSSSSSSSSFEILEKYLLTKYPNHVPSEASSR